jgi:DNA-binding transcriptional ArsR family regulator/transposase
VPRGPKLQPLDLSASETAQLTAWSRRRKTPRALAERARIILGSASGAPNLTVAAALGVTHQTVGKWRQRFLTARLDGLLDSPRPGAPRSITEGDVERVIRQTLESRPTEATQWSSRSMARAVGLSQTAVVRIWHAYGLQPHRDATFTPPTDPRARFPLPTNAPSCTLNHMVQCAQANFDVSFGALSDATRRGVLEQLGRADASITALAQRFHMTLTGMKKHVDVLEQAGLVTTEKVGRVRTCRLGLRGLHEEAEWIETYRQLWSARFDELDKVVENLKRKERVDGRKKRK